MPINAPAIHSLPVFRRTSIKSKGYAVHSWVDVAVGKWLAEESVEREMTISAIVREIVTKAYIARSKALDVDDPV